MSTNIEWRTIDYLEHPTKFYRASALYDSESEQAYAAFNWGAGDAHGDTQWSKGQILVTPHATVSEAAQAISAKLREKVRGGYVRQNVRDGDVLPRGSDAPRRLRDAVYLVVDLVSNGVVVPTESPKAEAVKINRQGAAFRRAVAKNG